MLNAELANDFMILIHYAPTEVYVHQWKSYNSGIVLQHTNNHATVSVVLEPGTGKVIELRASPEIGSYMEYRWINPEFKTAIFAEEISRANVIDYDVITLEMTEDYFEKAQALLVGEKPDPRVKIPLDFDERTQFDLMKLAHEKDMSLNQFVEYLLKKVVNNESKYSI